MRSLQAWLDQRRVGTLYEGDDLWSFEYDEAWGQAADAFDLAPDLPRAQRRHVDGGSARPVQWYFDNLLPEELLRQAILREAGIPGDDAFALLAYLGAESAGSLTLRPEGAPAAPAGPLRPLSPQALSARIAALPRRTLAADAPKRMSLAGAQHKLLVVELDGELYEPVGATPSTHLLKPAHPEAASWPASVANEFVTMRLAHAAGLPVPAVQRRYVPEPVYIVERFDRRVQRLAPGADGLPRLEVQRLHIVDACQLLGRSRLFKHTGASLQALNQLIERTTNKLLSRTRLFRWLAFNTLVGNDDCHLKNLSFFVSPEGVQVAPHYDLLATSVYSTRAFADDQARWPEVPLAIPLPGAATFGEVRREALLAAGQALGLGPPTARRILDDVRSKLPRALDHEIEAQQAAHAAAGAASQVHLAAEARLLSVLRSVVLRDMLDRLDR